MAVYPKARIYTVSELTAEIRVILEDSFSGIWLEGEVSNFRTHSSGHMYFTLKDEESQIRAAMFRSQNRFLKFIPREGLHVLVYGGVSLFEKRGEYQVYVEYMEPKGVGALQLAFEQLKERLAQEGLFDPAHKRPIPFLPRRIGIVTSPTGAVIRDILQILDRRFANLEVLIYPVTVQGETAAPEIVEAIEELNRRDGIDVLILARGGGSIEDLWAFNEEIVARAIYNSRVPVVSAIGHETDYTIADFVADLRAPTPSAAAELVVARKDELSQRLDDISLRMVSNVRYCLRRAIERLNGLSRHLALLSPQARISIQEKRLGELRSRFGSRMVNLLELIKAGLFAQIGKLDSLSPLAILSRGYSICRKLPSMEILKDARVVALGEGVAVILHQGELLCRVEEVKEPLGVSDQLSEKAGG